MAGKVTQPAIYGRDRVHHGGNPESGHELNFTLAEPVSENGVDPEVDTDSSLAPGAYRFGDSVNE
ncbi:hypothetical protein GCM10007386_25540 [Pseudoduganella dura]|nr:hypothetical protein GCM10007386_25540 [Pseudoduganella dura]